MALIDPTRLTDSECLALVEHLGLPLVSLDVDGTPTVDRALLAAMILDPEVVEQCPEYIAVERTVMIEVRLGRLTWREPRTVRTVSWR